MAIYESSLGAATSFDPQSTDVPPPVPSKEEKSQVRSVYTMKSPMATILMYRQSETNAPLMLASAADIYMNEKIDITSKLAQIETKDHEFWIDFILNYGEAYMREHNVQEIEKKLIKGIPQELRGIAYLSILNVKAVVETHTYESLVKKAKLADFEEGGSLESKSTDYGELVQVYWYCLKGTIHSNSQITGPLSNELIENLARILLLVKGVSKSENLTILFTLAESFSHISQNEFCFKGSRCVEDLASEQFVHISKQGIDIVGFFNTVFEQVAEYLNEEVILKVLDFIMIEGWDFLLRLVVCLFTEQKKKIFSLEGDELNEFLYSDKFFSKINLNTLERSVEVEIPIIKYENEFSLINANSISGNDNEISNLQECNQELTQKLDEVREKFAQLQKTHEEIFGQNSEYAKKLSEAREEKAFLSKRKEVLQEKYSQLTMQENLGNTIKANRDISAENHELELQIESLKKDVEAKAKMIK